MLTTIRHLMWHDARALRGPLAAWAGVLAVQIGVVAIGPSFLEPASNRIDINAGYGALMMRLAMTVILTAMLIQRDTAVGTTAFWLTRPIRPVAMWTAKLASIVAWCLLLPAGLVWVLFVGLGLSAGSALTVAWQLLTEQARFVAYAIMAASVTATLAHFVVTSLAGFAAWWFFASATAGWRAVMPFVTLPGVYSIYDAWMSAVIAGALIVSAHQYFTRRRARTWMLAVICFVIAQATLIVFRNTPSAGNATTSDRAFTPPEGVEVHIGDGSVTDEPTTIVGSTGQSTPGRALGGQVSIASSSETLAFASIGVASSSATTAGSLPTTIRWSESVRQGTREPAWLSNMGDQPYRSIRAALDIDTIVSLPSYSQIPTYEACLARWPMEAYRAFAAKGGGVLRAEVVVKAYRYVVAGTMPLKVGASYARGDQSVSIASVERTALGAVVTVRTAFVSAIDTNVAPQGAVHHVLRNRARREAVFFTDQQTSNILLTMGVGRSNPGTGLRRFEFDSQRPTQGRVALTNAWLDGAELVVLAPEALGTFTRSAEVWVQPNGVAK